MLAATDFLLLAPHVFVVMSKGFGSILTTCMAHVLSFVCPALGQSYPLTRICQSLFPRSSLGRKLSDSSIPSVIPFLSNTPKPFAVYVSSLPHMTNITVRT